MQQFPFLQICSTAQHSPAKTIEMEGKRYLSAKRASGHGSAQRDGGLPVVRHNVAFQKQPLTATNHLNAAPPVVHDVAEQQATACFIRLRRWCRAVRTAPTISAAVVLVFVTLLVVTGRPLAQQSLAVIMSWRDGDAVVAVSPHDTTLRLAKTALVGKKD